MKVVAIIQARMDSTRLPGKVMKKIAGKTVLEHVINRVKLANEVNDIIIATTSKSADDLIVEEATNLGIKYFRGSESNVLSRYYYTAKKYGADIVVRVTSDCPLIDPNVINEVICCFKEGDYDIVSNAGSDLSKRSYPRGLDTEVFSFSKLEEAFKESDKYYQKEHVTPYIYENSKKQHFYQNDVNYSNHRWTLDTLEDFELISLIYNSLYGDNNYNFFLTDIISLFEKYPELIKVNQMIVQKKLK